MKRLIIAAIATTLLVPALASANEAIDKAAKEKGADHDIFEVTWTPEPT